jgi:hypothetical protein
MLLGCFLAYQQSLDPATGNVGYKAITQSNYDSYRILESKVQTDRGKAIIRNHKHTSMRKRCTRSLSTTNLSLPRPRLNHLLFSLTCPQQNLVMDDGMVLLKPLSFIGKVKYISMRNMVLQLIISQMVRHVSYYKTLSMVSSGQEYC